MLDYYEPEMNLSHHPNKILFDFEACTLDDLKTVDFNFTHAINRTGICNGYALYFEAYFRIAGEQHEFVVLKTGPESS